MSKVRVMLHLFSGLVNVDWVAFYRCCSPGFVWWAAGVGLTLKLIFLRFVRFTWRECMIADITMNAASSLSDFLTIRVAAVMWATPLLLVTSSVHIKIENTNPVLGVPVLVIFTIFRTLLEASVLRLMSKSKPTKRAIALLFLVNVITVSIGVFGMIRYAHAHPIVA